MIVDTEASIHFLRTAYEPDDWIAVFLKSYETGQTVQRVGPLSLFLEPKVHAWLRAMNARRFNVYVSVNAVREGQRTRTKNAIGAIRHIFLEADQDGPNRLADITARADLPPVSYVLESSPGRLHFFWRVEGFSTEAAERLQKHMARELGTDPAATSCSQTTRIAGYLNHKRRPSHLTGADTCCDVAVRCSTASALDSHSVRRVVIFQPCSWPCHTMTIRLTESDIEAALPRVAVGLSKYLWLQAQRDASDVRSNSEYRKRFNGFYRVRRGLDWQEHFFGLLEAKKGQTVPFTEVLEELHRTTGRYEASFASKLWPQLTRTCR
jgi:hypothetical protein